MVVQEKPIRIAIAEDNEHTRKYFENLFLFEKDIEVVCLATSGKDLVDKLQMIKCDVILMDIQMESKYDGIETTKKLLSDDPSLKIIMLTICEDSETIMLSFEVGAVDYIIKDDSGAVIICAVRDAYNNSSPIRPRIAGKIRKYVSSVNYTKDNLLHLINIISSLTNMEREILGEYIKGKKIEKIADERFVTISTIKYHNANIMKKLKKNSIKEVVELIRQNKLVDLFNNYQK